MCMEPVNNGPAQMRGGKRTMQVGEVGDGRAGMGHQEEHRIIAIGPLIPHGPIEQALPPPDHHVGVCASRIEGLAISERFRLFSRREIDDVETAGVLPAVGGEVGPRTSADRHTHP